MLQNTVHPTKQGRLSLKVLSEHAALGFCWATPFKTVFVVTLFLLFNAVVELLVCIQRNNESRPCLWTYDLTRLSFSTHVERLYLCYVKLQKQSSCQEQKRWIIQSAQAESWKVEGKISWTSDKRFKICIRIIGLLG